MVLGAGIVLLAAAVGHCSAFGGRCPAEPPPLWDDDVFGTAAMGAALAVGLPATWINPSGYGVYLPYFVAGGESPHDQSANDAVFAQQR